MTLEQQATLDRLATEHPSVAVRESLSMPGTGPFVQMTVASGPFHQTFRVFEDGVPHETQPDYSVSFEAVIA